MRREVIRFGNMFGALLAMQLISVILAIPITNCGQCDCFPRLTFHPEYLVCQGHAVNTFPDLAPEAREYILEIHLYTTLITSLPPLGKEQYIRLEVVEERNNAMLNCEWIEEWQTSHPHCSFSSDCLNKTTPTTQPVSSTTTVRPHQQQSEKICIIAVATSGALLLVAALVAAIVGCPGGSGGPGGPGGPGPCPRRRRPRRPLRLYLPPSPNQCSDPGVRTPTAPAMLERDSFEMADLAYTNNHYELE